VKPEGWVDVQERLSPSGAAPWGAASRVVQPRAISYAPWLLFLSALVLLVSYLPYARVFDMYMVSQEMAQGNVFPWSDPQLLSILSNLQYPFQFVRGPDIWHAALWIAFGIVMATTAYVFWRVRVSPAGN